MVCRQCFDPICFGLWSVYNYLVYLFKEMVLILKFNNMNSYILPGISDLRKCFSFSKDGKWMAMLHRKSISISQQQDYISLFLIENWKCAITFPISTIKAQTVLIINLFKSRLHGLQMTCTSLFSIIPSTISSSSILLMVVSVIDI